MCQFILFANYPNIKSPGVSRAPVIQTLQEVMALHISATATLSKQEMPVKSRIARNRDCAWRVGDRSSKGHA